MCALKRLYRKPPRSATNRRRTQVVAADLVPAAPGEHVVPRTAGGAAHVVAVRQALRVRARRVGPRRAGAARRAVPGPTLQRCAVGGDARLARRRRHLWLARYCAARDGKLCPGQRVRAAGRRAATACQRARRGRDPARCRGQEHAVCVHWAGEQGPQPAVRVCARRQRRARDALARGRPLPVGSRGRHEDERLPQLDGVGRQLCRHGRRRCARRTTGRGCFRALHARIESVSGRQPSRQRPGARQALLPRRHAWGLGLFHQGEHVHCVRLHRGGAQGNAHSRRALAGAQSGGARHTRHAERRRRRLVELREAPRPRVVRVVQPRARVWRHYD